MRPSKNRKLLGLTSLLVLLLAASPGPVSAQASGSASPGAAQYSLSSAPVLDVGDIPPAASENVADGTATVNEAASDPEVSSAASPAARPVADPTGQGLTALPETGGVSPPVQISAKRAVASLPGYGVVLVFLVLTANGFAGR